MPEAELSLSAKYDIAEVVVSLSRFSDTKAQLFRDDVTKACRVIGRSPKMGRSRDDLSPGLRSHTALSPYLVFYRITDDGVVIERIIHGSRKIVPSMFE